MRFFSFTRKKKPIKAVAPNLKSSIRNKELNELTNQELRERLQSNLSKLPPSLQKINSLVNVASSLSRSKTQRQKPPKIKRMPTSHTSKITRANPKVWTRNRVQKLKETGNYNSWAQNVKRQPKVVPRPRRHKNVSL